MTNDPYDVAMRAITGLRDERDDANRHERDAVAELAEFRDKLAALAAIEDYIAESGENAARNMRDLLAGTGDDDNDPRVQARRWDLTW